MGVAGKKDMDDDERQESSCGDGARRPSLEEEQISNPEEEIVKCTRCSEQDAVVECRTCSPDCEGLWLLVKISFAQNYPVLLLSHRSTRIAV